MQIDTFQFQTIYLFTKWSRNKKNAIMQNWNKYLLKSDATKMELQQHHSDSCIVQVALNNIKIVPEKIVLW